MDVSDQEVTDWLEAQRDPLHASLPQSEREAYREWRTRLEEAELLKLDAAVMRIIGCDTFREARPTVLKLLEMAGEVQWLRDLLAQFEAGDVVDARDRFRKVEPPSRPPPPQPEPPAKAALTLQKLVRSEAQPLLNRVRADLANLDASMVKLDEGIADFKRRLIKLEIAYGLRRPDGTTAH